MPWLPPGVAGADTRAGLPAGGAGDRSVGLRRGAAVAGSRSEAPGPKGIGGTVDRWAVCPRARRRRAGRRRDLGAGRAFGGAIERFRSRGDPRPRGGEPTRSSSGPPPGGTIGATGSDGARCGRAAQQSQRCVHRSALFRPLAPGGRCDHHGRQCSGVRTGVEGRRGHKRGGARALSCVTGTAPGRSSGGPITSSSRSRPGGRLGKTAYGTNPPFGLQSSGA